jgi:hypothetical protein
MLLVVGDCSKVFLTDTIHTALCLSKLFVFLTDTYLLLIPKCTFTPLCSIKVGQKRSEKKIKKHILPTARNIFSEKGK